MAGALSAYSRRRPACSPPTRPSPTWPGIHLELRDGLRIAFTSALMGAPPRDELLSRAMTLNATASTTALRERKPSTLWIVAVHRTERLVMFTSEVANVVPRVTAR